MKNSDPVNDIVIFPSKGGLFFFAALALGFIGIGLYFVLAPSSDIESQWLGGICVAIFGMFMGYIIYRMNDSNPILVINNEGIFDNASMVSAGLIPWPEISGVRINVYKGQRFLGIITKNPKEILKRQSILKRIPMRLNHLMVGTPFNIPEHILPMALEEVEEKINERLNLSQKDK